MVCEVQSQLRQRGASNAGYHYLGCAKTMALIGEAFAHEERGMIFNCPSVTPARIFNTDI